MQTGHSFLPVNLTIMCLLHCDCAKVIFTCFFLYVHVVPVSWVVGVIIAVKGQEKKDAPGKFVVEEYCYQEVPSQHPPPTLDDDK